MAQVEVEPPHVHPITAMRGESTEAPRTVQDLFEDLDDMAGVRRQSTVVATGEWQRNPSVAFP